jgi:uncharacterized membrane protein YdjX (TVP38/TMEM64 family)
LGARGRVVRWTLLATLALAVIIAPFVLLEEPIAHALRRMLQGAEDRPWLSALVIIALLAGDSVLPVPSSIVSTFAGGAFGFAQGAAVIWIGLNLGCLFGYALGASAGRLAAVRVVGVAELERANRLAATIGPVALIVMRAVPVLAEVSVLAAGAASMPRWSFLAATAVANTIAAGVYAATGAAAASTGIFLFAFLGLAGLPAAAWAVWRLWAQRAGSKNESDNP